jgi:hypothetical protein
MQSTIINASPMALVRGTQDQSTRQLSRDPIAIPQHLPKFYLYAQKGPAGTQLVVGDTAVSTYGADTFDLRKKWANHATVFANGVNAQGNLMVVDRIFPDDIGPESNVLLSLDVLPTQLDVYERNVDGSFKLTVSGDRISTGVKVAGYLVKWVASTNDTVTKAQNFGQATILPGDQTDVLTSTQSQRYPVLELKASSLGSIGNNSGIRLWAPVSTTSALNQTMMSSAKAYPYRVSVIRRQDTTSSPVVIQSNFSEQYLDFTFKPSVIDPVNDSLLYFGDKFKSSYENINDPAYTPVFGDFGSVAIYDANIEALVQMFHTAEMLHSEANTDFTGAPGEQHLFNFVSGTSSDGRPYNTFALTTNGSASVRMSEYTNIYAMSGSDGTMNDDLFAALVAKRVAEYIDENSFVQDDAFNVESIIYDSGFPLATKYALAGFISVRKDTFVALCTHTSGQPELTASEEHSMAVALRTRLQMYPESDYFGTPVSRGIIMGRSARIRESQWTKPTPVLYEVAVKSARYMGASDGRWKAGYNFDGAPGSVLEFMYDVNVTFTPALARNKDWAAGLNWVQQYDHRSLFIPALKTVYGDDTSVLNSYFVGMAICQINKVTKSVWRMFSGVDHLTDAQLIERVDAETNKRLQGRFDSRYIIVPASTITDTDNVAGYRWTTPVKIYAPNMKTVMTTSVHAFRMGDYKAV